MDTHSILVVYHTYYYRLGTRTRNLPGKLPDAHGCMLNIAPEDMIHADTRALLQSPVPVSSRASPAGERTIRGLDSIRFWCALWVYFSHFGFIPRPRGWGWPIAAVGIYNNLFCGVGAVIAFFVISGFCIHYPFVGTQKLPLGAFYVRRYVRIVCPLAVALLLGSLLGERLVSFYENIIWSLIAELIYYTIYPVLRIAFLRWKWDFVLAAYAGAFALIALHPSAGDFHQFGPELTWVVGLPSWLLGCGLATWASEDRSSRRTAPWLWRGTVWAAGSSASVLRFHAGIGYPLTLTIFGVLVFFWIREEIRYYRFAPAPVFLEFCGRWSYSIYLVHGLAVIGLALLRYETGFPLRGAPYWALQTIFVLMLSFCFYLAVEMPSHRLARYLARVVRKREELLAGQPSRGL